MRSLFVVLLSAGILITGIAAAQEKKQPPAAVVSFDNQMGQTALVSIYGPVHVVIEIPDRETRTVEFPAGEYFAITRYGDEPGPFTYVRGEPFVARSNSSIRMTLHPDEIAREAWERARSLDTVSAYKTFIDSHPRSHFARSAVAAQISLLRARGVSAVIGVLALGDYAPDQAARNSRQAVIDQLEGKLPSGFRLVLLGDESASDLDDLWGILRIRRKARTYGTGWIYRNEAEEREIQMQLTAKKTSVRTNWQDLTVQGSRKPGLSSSAFDWSLKNEWQDIPALRIVTDSGD